MVRPDSSTAVPIPLDLEGVVLEPVRKPSRTPLGKELVTESPEIVVRHGFVEGVEPGVERSALGFRQRCSTSKQGSRKLWVPCHHRPVDVTSRNTVIEELALGEATIAKESQLQARRCFTRARLLGFERGLRGRCLLITFVVCPIDCVSDPLLSLDQADQEHDDAQQEDGRPRHGTHASTREASFFQRTHRDAPSEHVGCVRASVVSFERQERDEPEPPGSLRAEPTLPREAGGTNGDAAMEDGLAGSTGDAGRLCDGVAAAGREGRTTRARTEHKLRQVAV